MSDVFFQLSQVQAELKAPKGQRNTFGNYNYRSAEDILEAAKPKCIEHGLVLVVSDEVVEVGGRVYVRAEATVIEQSGDGRISVYGWAREADAKKGMDASQLTGATSSYARKYALGGLFALDDTKDADSNEARQQEAGRGAPAAAENARVDAVRQKVIATLKAKGAPADEVKMKCLEFGAAGLSEVKDVATLESIRNWAEQEGWK